MATRSVLEILSALAPTINRPKPSAVFSSEDGATIKLRELLIATCDDLLKEHPWQFLNKRTSISTVSGQEAYPLPADCDRLTSLSFYDAVQGWPVRGSLTAPTWSYLKTSGISQAPYTKFRLFDNRLHLSPVPTTNGHTIVYEYVSNAYARSSGNVPKSILTEDSDIILFDHRLVIYGTKLKWLENDGHDTTAAFVEFNRALEHVRNADTPSDVIHFGGKRGDGLISTAQIYDWA